MDSPPVLLSLPAMEVALAWIQLMVMGLSVVRSCVNIRHGQRRSYIK